MRSTFSIPELDRLSECTNVKYQETETRISHDATGIVARGSVTIGDANTVAKIFE